MTVDGETTRNTTIVDEYVRQLSDLGISLQSLGLLGEADISEEDKKLTEKELIDKILDDPNYKEQKENIEKYITEFVKADLMTQEIHRRRGTQLTDELDGHDDWVDGGVYLYRTRQKGLISSALDIDSSEHVKVVNNTEYVQMVYVTPEKFEELVNKKSEKLRYRYTIDEETGELQIAQIKTVETKKKDITNGVTEAISSLFGADTTEVEVEKIISIDYKAEINEYTMPYEFLINLCQITANPEYVYHVAQLARETYIMLAIQDDTTEEHVTTIEEDKYETYTNSGSNSVSGASISSDRIQKTQTDIITTTMIPHLQLEFANTWSFFKNYEYSKTINETTTTNGPIIQNYDLPSTLPNYKEGNNNKDTISTESKPEEIYEPSYWYGEFMVQKTTTTETTVTVTEYMPPIEKNSVEKSKQFLGLLRNSTGKCENNGQCYNDVQKARECAKHAEFDKKGINVTYKLPGRTKEEEPFEKLKSGEQMLYSLLGAGTQGEANISLSEDAVSDYTNKMDGIIEHMQYLMTLPENEMDLTDLLKDLIDDFIAENPEDILTEEEYGEINVDDIIIKTDEIGALRAPTRNELIAVITSLFKGQKRENALSLVDTLIECQDKYKVNAIFILAMSQQETNIGTANTSHVKNNNWLSWSLGTTYSSPQHNVETVMKGIATSSIYFTQGKITIKDIGYTYCPNTADYPTQGDGWVLGVTSWVKKMYDKLGITFGTDDLGAYSGSYTIAGHTYVHYKQGSGSPWAENEFASGKMKNKGCSLTALAIVIRGYGDEVTPETLRQELGGNLPDLVAVLQKHGVSSTRTQSALTSNQIIEHLQTKRPIIVHVNGEWTSSSGHYMVLLDYRNKNGVDEVYVSNPATVNSTKNGWIELSRITNNMMQKSILIDSY